MVNPYIAGNPVGGDTAFIGRQDVLREVTRVLTNPSTNAIVLYGQRRIGKTSILQQLAQQLPHEGAYLPVYFDLQDKAAWPLERVLFVLAQTISHELDLPQPEAVTEESFQQQFLPQVLAHLKQVESSLVFLFDEFDVLDNPTDQAAGKAFFPYLTRLLNLAPKQLQFVFVIGRKPEDLTNLTLQVFKNIAAQRVSLLNEADTRQVILLSQENGSLQWTEEAMAEIWQLTNGHPYLTQMLGQTIWDAAYLSDPDDVPTVTLDMVTAALPKTIESSTNALEWLWQGLASAERFVSSALAQAGQKAISQDELEKLLTDNGVRVLISQLQNAPQLLVEWDLLEWVNDGYRFRVELLRRWIAEKKPISRVRAELDQIEPVANNLYQAGKTLYLGGQINQAIVQLRQAIKFNPNHVDAGLLLAQLLMANVDSLDEAIKLLEQIFTYNPSAARYELVKALHIQADSITNSKQKIYVYEKIVEVDPHDQVAIQLKAFYESDIAINNIEVHGTPYNAIGDGARVIVNQIYGTAEELRIIEQIENSTLANGIIQYIISLTNDTLTLASKITESPYRSLAPYRILDNNLFFGRDDEIEKLTKIIKKSRGITIIHAKSGVGKTSLIQAGLAANLLIESGLPLYVRSRHRPPIEAIKETIYSSYKIFEGLRNDTLSNFIKRIRQTLAPSTPLVIFLDQFEEFFIYLDQNQRQDFISQLGDCLDVPLLSVHFVLSLRTEYFSFLSEFKSRIPFIFTEEYLLKPLTKTQAELAIIKPAEIAGISYESKLVDFILSELSTRQYDKTVFHGLNNHLMAFDEIMPIPLQLVCSALYQQIQETNRKIITFYDFIEMGQVSGILNNYLQRVLEREIIPPLRKQARATLIALLDSQNRRITKTAAEIARDTGSVDTLPRVLDQLVQSRLLNRLVDESHDEEPVYELTHEYLIERIQLTAEEQEIKFATELLYKAVEEHERDPTILLDEKRLQIIELQESNLIITEVAKELLARSKKEVITQKRGRTIRIVSIFVLIILVIAILIIAASLQESGRIADESLKTATQVIRSAKDEADKARAVQATAEKAASKAQTAEGQAIKSQNIAETAEAQAVEDKISAELSKGVAQTAEAQAIEAKQVAVSARYVAETAQAGAIFAQATAESERFQAIALLQTVAAVSTVEPQPQTTHFVQANETLTDIANQYTISVSILMKANKLPNETITTGQTLIIPKTYIVQSNDLSRIATELNSSVVDIINLNQLTREVLPGDILIVPK